MIRSARAPFLAVICAIGCCRPAAGLAQAESSPAAASHGAAAERTSPAEPFLPPSHWTRDALRRLAGAGLLEPGVVAVAWPLGRARVRALLEHASATEASRGTGPGLAAAFSRRFEEEFPGAQGGGAEGGDPSTRVRGRLGVGWGGSRGLLLGGTHDPTAEGGWRYRGPVSVPAAASLVAAPAVEITHGASLALFAGASVGGANGRASAGGGGGAGGGAEGEAPGIRAGQVYASARHGDLALWVGRRAFSLGPGAAGGIVLSDHVLFHGVGAEAPGGARLPGVLGVLGPVRGATLFSRLERSGEIGRPWFWAARVGFSPTPDLAIGLNRATIFGGDGNEPVTFRNVALMLLGFTETGSKSSDFENQVASVDLLWRTGTRGLPLLVRGEWGFADVGGAWFRVPGVSVALEAPVVPRVPALALGIEHASFSGSGDGHPPWYRHGPLGEGWSDRGRLLGHPMGGHGTEWALRFRIDPDASEAEAPGAAAPRIHEISGRVFQRHRGEENLFAPERGGTAVGGELRLSARGGERIGLEGEVEWESGRVGWRAWSAGVRSRILLGSASRRPRPAVSPPGSRAPARRTGATQGAGASSVPDGAMPSGAAGP